MTRKETASDWLLRVWVVAKRLNQESMGDCLSGTVAGAPTGLSRDASQAKPLTDYRKDANRD